MSTSQFRLSIGAKRQVTLPAELLEQLRVADRGELLVEVIGDHAVVTPMVSVPRAQLPEELRRTFESRRGARSSDMPLAKFLEEIGYQAPAEEAIAPPRLSRVERLASLTENEKQTVQQYLARPASARAVVRGTPALTEQEIQIVEQMGQQRTPREIAQSLGISERRVRSYAARLGRKLGKQRDEARSAGG